MEPQEWQQKILQRLLEGLEIIQEESQGNSDQELRKSEKPIVSEQKADEDFLLGNSNKTNEGQGASSESSNKNDKVTIEMERIFFPLMTSLVFMGVKFWLNRNL